MCVCVCVCVMVTFHCSPPLSTPLSLSLPPISHLLSLSPLPPSLYTECICFSENDGNSRDGTYQSSQSAAGYTSDYSTADVANRGQSYYANQQDTLYGQQYSRTEGLSYTPYHHYYRCVTIHSSLALTLSERDSLQLYYVPLGRRHPHPTSSP